MFEILKGFMALLVAIAPGGVPILLTIAAVRWWWKKRHQVSSEDKPTV